MRNKRRYELWIEVREINFVAQMNARAPGVILKNCHSENIWVNHIQCLKIKILKYTKKMKKYKR